MIKTLRCLLPIAESDSDYPQGFHIIISAIFNIN